MKLDCFLTPYTKTNTKWIDDLNIRPETIRHTEGHIGDTLLDISFSHIILDLSLQTRATKAKKKKRNKQIGLHQTEKPGRTKKAIN